MPLFQNSVPCEKCGAPIPRRSFRLQPLRCPECRDLGADAAGCLTFLVAICGGIAVGFAVASLLPLIVPGANPGMFPVVLGFIAGFDTAAIIGLIGQHRASDEDLYSTKSRLELAIRFATLALLTTGGLEPAWRGTFIIANGWIGYLTVPRLVDWVRQRDAVAALRRAESAAAAWSAPDFDDSTHSRNGHE